MCDEKGKRIAPPSQALWSLASHERTRAAPTVEKSLTAFGSFGRVFAYFEPLFGTSPLVSTHLINIATRRQKVSPPTLPCFCGHLRPMERTRAAPIVLIPLIAFTILGCVSAYFGPTLDGNLSRPLTLDKTSHRCSNIRTRCLFLVHS